MTVQLNTRISPIYHLIFETIQDTLKENGIEMNQRQLVEMMILKTHRDIEVAIQNGKDLKELW